MTLDDGNGTIIAFASDLEWRNEFDWSPVSQSTEWTEGGNLVVQEGVKLAGREMKLDGGADVFVSRSVIETLNNEIAISQGKSYTLTLADSRTFNVMFHHPAMKATVVAQTRKRIPDQNTKYRLALSLIMV